MHVFCNYVHEKEKEVDYKFDTITKRREILAENEWLREIYYQILRS